MDTIFPKRLEKYLSLRPHSAKELELYLTRKLQLGVASMQTIWSNLQQAGYIDDEAFALWWVTGRLSQGKYGKSRVVMELVTKGIAKDTAERVWKSRETLQENDEGEAGGVTQERLKARLKLELEKLAGRNIEFDLKQKNKIIRKYLARGFSYQEISRSLGELL